MAEELIDAEAQALGIHEVACSPSGATPWATVAGRLNLHARGIATPVSGDALAKDPTFATEFPTLESYLEAPC